MGMIDGVNDGNESNNDYDEEEEDGMYIYSFNASTHTPWIQL